MIRKLVIKMIRVFNDNTLTIIIIMVITNGKDIMMALPNMIKVIVTRLTRQPT